MPDAWIDHTQRFRLEKRFRQRLRFDVAVGIEIRAHSGRRRLVRRSAARGGGSKVVKRRAEVAPVVVVGDRIFEAANLRELNCLVEAHFRLRGLERKRGIPGAAARSVEAAAERMRVTKGRVDDGRVGNRTHQFLDADARQPLPRRKQAVVRRRIQLENRLQMRVVVADGDEHAVALRQMP